MTPAKIVAVHRVGLYPNPVVAIAHNGITLTYQLGAYYRNAATCVQCGNSIPAGETVLGARGQPDLVFCPACVNGALRTP